MDKTYSMKIKRVARDLKITPDDLAFADLIAVGWTVADAWAAVIGTGRTWPPAQLAKEQRDKANNPAVKERIEDVRDMLSRSQVSRAVEKKNAQERKEEKIVLAKAMSKEKMLVDLYTLRERLTPGSPEYLKVNQQIIDVSAMKKDEVKTEDDTIHYYLPRKCYDCEYKTKYEKRNESVHNQS